MEKSGSAHLLKLLLLSKKFCAPSSNLWHLIDFQTTVVVNPVIISCELFTHTFNCIFNIKKTILTEERFQPGTVVTLWEEPCSASLSFTEKGLKSIDLILTYLELLLSRLSDQFMALVSRFCHLYFTLADMALGKLSTLTSFSTTSRILSSIFS